jgi:hypothetical protein
LLNTHKIAFALKKLVKKLEDAGQTKCHQFPDDTNPIHDKQAKI